MASGFPRMDHPGRRVEVEDFVSSVPLVDDDGEPLTEDELISMHAAYRVRIATIDIDYFEALDQPVLDGRNFDAADLEPDAPLTVIVDEAFIEGVLEGQNLWEDGCASCPAPGRPWTRRRRGTRSSGSFPRSDSIWSDLNRMPGSTSRERLARSVP